MLTVPLGRVVEEHAAYERNKEVKLIGGGAEQLAKHVAEAVRRAGEAEQGARRHRSRR